MTDEILQRTGRWSGDGRLYAVLSAAGFSLKAVFVKLAYAAGPVEPAALLAMRMGIALPLFVWLAWVGAEDSKTPLGQGDIVRITVLGCIGYYLSSLFDFNGLVYISAGLERLILYIYPTLVLLLQAWHLRRWPTVRAWQAMAICYAGLAVAFAHDLHQSTDGTGVMIGAAWIFASAVTYAFYYAGTGRMVGRIGSTRLAGLSGSASCVLVLGHFLVFGDMRAFASLPAAVWIDAALMALVSTALPVWWLSLAIRRMGAGPAATIGTLGPVLTVFAAWLMLGESLSLLQAGGLALVMLGVMRLKSPAGEAARPAVASSATARSH